MPVFSVGMTCILLVPIPFTVKKPSGATETALSSPKKRTLLPVPAGDRLAVILGTSLFPFVIFGGNFKVIDVGCCLACAGVIPCASLQSFYQRGTILTL